MSPDNQDYVIETLDDGLVLRLTRPARLNAITRAVLLGLKDCLDRLECSGQPVLVITGEGVKSFCAGTDLAETQAMAPADRQAKTIMARELFVRLSRSKVISVAAINGLAYGGGLELAMACTFRVAAPHASFSLPEIKLGVLPAYGGTQFLPALIGKARASEMMLCGEPVNAEKAMDIGLIHRLARAPEGHFDAQSLMQEALAMARQVTRFSPLAIAAIRSCVAAAGDEVTDVGLQVEDEQVRKVFVSEDAREGIAAFLEKRPATFTGR